MNLLREATTQAEPRTLSRGFLLIVAANSDARYRHLADIG